MPGLKPPSSRVRLLALLCVSVLASCTGNPVVGGLGDASNGPDKPVAVDVPDGSDIVDVPDGSDIVDADDADDADDAADASDVVDAADASDAPARCATNADCAAMATARVCDAPSGRCVVCTASDQGGCSPAEHCDPTANVCVPGCRSDEGCRAGADAGVDGGGAGRCDTARFVCVECAADGDCPAGRLCVGSVCAPGCNATHGCATGQTCCTGACADLQTNLANCGACTNLCRTANGTPACMNGNCTAGTCGEGFADCNRRNDDGCETTLNTDLANCGACGTACPTPANASAATCAAGRCGFTCNPSFADCDGAAANGCEVDLRASATHCGLCGNACPPRDHAATGVCSMGRCDVVCDASFGNCDGNAENGCELDLRADVSHCGSCAVACPVRPNTTPTCAAGACGFTCNPGFGDCDGDASNGCEVALSTDRAHCGRCAVACATPTNAQSSSCASARCEFVCRPPYVDCDGDAANGCEVDPRTSTTHCGGCGMACPARANALAVCAGGTCGITCAAGFGDCDGDATNGCEVDLRTTVSSCGRCGNRCAVAGGAPACVGGACTVASCGGGFGDCNMSAGDGCETDTRSAVGDCGACGVACPVRANAFPVCSLGTCGSTCRPGFGECDGVEANGCEVSLATSVLHCGSCGRSCVVPNATAACAASTCAIASCNAGFADCNGSPGDGCEVNTNTTVTSCGACGRACAVADGTAGCVGGACAVVACDAGFGNCDGVAANGCEVNLLSTVRSCGSCGRVCAVANGTAGCAAGACTVAACNAGFANCNASAADGCEVNLRTDVNNCGACGARGTEVCDGVDNNCNGAVDEGCPTGISGLTTFDFQSTAWGGGGGGAYDMQCPAGQFVTGIFGRSGSLLDAVGIVCGTPVFVEDRSVTPYRYRIDVTPAGTVGAVGGGGGGAFRYDCPANSMAMRALGRAGGFVDQFRVECYRWDVENAAGVGWRVVRSGATGISGAYGGGGGGAFDYTCPSAGGGQPSAMRRVFGGSGGYVDRLGVWCTWPVLNLR